MKFLSLSLLLALMVFGAAGCSSTTDNTPIDLTDIPFDLVVPPPPAAAYFINVGTKVVQSDVTVPGDSLPHSGSAGSFYAQFWAPAGSIFPKSVTVNGNPLSKYKGPDTLRLASATSTNVYGKETWVLTDSTGAATTFQSDIVTQIDSVAPLYTGNAVRSDTALTLHWALPSSGSSGLYLTWTVDNQKPYTTYVSETGSFSIPKSVMETLRGKGTVTITRFRNDQFTFLGKTVNLARSTERDYQVLVLN